MKKNLTNAGVFILITLLLQSTTLASPFSDLVDRGNNYYESPWLGGIYSAPNNNGWVWHVEHGWLFPITNTDNEDLFLYDPTLSGWLYTSRSVYPFLYSFNHGGDWWYYYRNVKGPGTNTRKFYSFRQGRFVYLAPYRLANIASTAIAAGNFNTLVTALSAADLVSALSGDTPFTVFAPTDEAFAKLPAGTIETLLLPENKSLLTDILLYHVLPGTAFSPDLATGWKTMVNGVDAKISINDHGVRINQAQVVLADLGAANGVIHVIDTVILPPGLIPTVAGEARIFQTLLAAVGAADLASTLSGAGPFTVFAPTDEAFAKLPAGTVENLLRPENKATLTNILLYHVVPGKIYSSQVAPGPVSTANGSDFLVSMNPDGLFINGSVKIVDTDILAANGVIHVIDSVILPREPIPGELTKAGIFGTLLAAVGAADLAATLSGPGPFTVFAPTDAAFAKLPPGTVESLLQPENKVQLTNILLYHVLPTKVYAKDVAPGALPTIGGSSIALTTENGKVILNGSATVTGVDWLAVNGVVHTIDTVLLPPAR